MFAKRIDQLLKSAEAEAKVTNDQRGVSGLCIAAGLFAIAQSIFALAIKSPYGALTQAEIAKLKDEDNEG